MLNFSIFKRIKILNDKNIRKENYSDINNNNKLITNLFTLLITIFLSVMVVLSTIIDSLNKATKTYFAGVIVLLIFCFFEVILDKKLEKKSLFFVYIFWNILFFFLLYISLIVFDSTSSVTLIMFSIVFPLIITDNYLRKIYNSLLLLLIYVILGSIYKNPDIFLLDSLNIFSGTIIGLFVGLIHLLVKTERYKTQDELKTKIRDSAILAEDLKISLSTQQIVSDVIMEVNQASTSQKISGGLLESVFIKIRTIFDADKSFLYIYNDGKFENGNIFLKEGLEGKCIDENADFNKLSDIYLEKLKNGKTIYFDNRYELVNSHLFDNNKQIYPNVNRLILEPIIRNGDLLGICGLDNPVMNNKQSLFCNMKTVGYVICDLIEVVETRRLLETLTYKDYLTRLGNRNAYEKFIQQYNDNPISGSIGIIFSDLNGLKETNDTLGHVQGDKLIVEMGDILRKELKKSFLFRIGGDEFIAILENENLDYFNKKTKEFIKAINDSKLISASIGSAYTESGNSRNLTELIEEADQNMYKEKQKHYLK